ncbi:hypothetical protein B0H14DRAFT_2784262 [Mycena olivaceomarginata]|nr:hypothetical protein B0H14DRAFT_2784262 [Mycena olivaceomarginata]
MGGVSLLHFPFNSFSSLYQTPASAVSGSFPLFGGGGGGGQPYSPHPHSPYSPSPHSHSQGHRQSTYSPHPQLSLAAYPQYGTPPSHSASATEFAPSPRASASSFGHSPASGFAHSHSPGSRAGSGSSLHSPAPGPNTGLRAEYGGGGYEQSHSPLRFPQQHEHEQNGVGADVDAGAGGGFALVTPAPQYAFDARALDASVNASPMQLQQGGLADGMSCKQEEEEGEGLAEYDAVTRQMEMEVDAAADALFGVGGVSMGAVGMGQGSWVEQPSMPPMSASASAAHTLASLASASSLHALSSASPAHNIFSSPSHASGSAQHDLYGLPPSPSRAASSGLQASPSSPRSTIAAATSGGTPMLSLRIPQSHARTRTRTDSGAGAGAGEVGLPALGSILSFESYSYAGEEGGDEEMGVPPASPLSPLSSEESIASLLDDAVEDGVGGGAGLSPMRAMARAGGRARGGDADTIRYDLMSD